MKNIDLKSKIPEEVISLLKKLRSYGHQCYLVGGSVRDIALKREILDWDVATSALPETVMKIFKKAYPTGIKHGTVTVLYRRLRFEVTTFRSESDYTDGRHPERIKFGVSIYEDLKRRDFTINAIAYDPLEDVIIDPYGGMEDLRKGVIRCVNRAYDRFSEDGLRTLRAIRFATVLNFRLNRDIIPAIRETIPVFLKVSVERVRDEILKMMKADRPSKGIRLMKEAGLLDYVFPELLPTIGFKQNRWHKYDLFEHSLLTMDFLDREDPELRLVGLLHDIAKPYCKAGDTLDATYYGHDLKGAEMVEEVFKRLKFSNRSIERARLIVANHMIGYNSNWTDAAIRRLIKRLGSEVHSLIKLQMADVKARGRQVKSSIKLLEELKKRVYDMEKKKTALDVNQLAVNGHDVMKIRGIPPSPEVGRILKRLLEMVIERPELNKRETLLKLIEEV